MTMSPERNSPSIPPASSSTTTTTSVASSHSSSSTTGGGGSRGTNSTSTTSSASAGGSTSSKSNNNNAAIVNNNNNNGSNTGTDLSIEHDNNNNSSGAHGDGSPCPPSSAVVSDITKTRQHSVIKATSGVQLISRNEVQSKVGSSPSSLEDLESKRRREVLERRPSYRKILNDLSSAEVSAIAAQFNQNLHQQQQQLLHDIKSEPEHHPNPMVNLNGSSTSSSSSSVGVISPPSILSAAAAAAPYLKVVPTSTIQLAPGSGELSGLSALTVTSGSNSGANSGGGGGSSHPSSASAIVQYTHSGQDGQPFLVPVTAYPNAGHFPSSMAMSPDLQYPLRSGSSGGSSVISLNTVGPHQVEEVSKKREIRLLKNREAAKECRRKKKEYIKCLENRVAVLENQNKALIEELKSLKELYCSKGD